MSIMKLVKVECPRCGNKQKIPLWETINVQMSPKAKTELLEGKINRLCCASCGFETAVQATLMYHDIEKHFCIYFYPFLHLESRDFYDEFTVDAQINMDLGVAAVEVPDYFRNAHIVFSMEELVRYVIFRDRLAQEKTSLNRREGA